MSRTAKKRWSPGQKGRVASRSERGYLRKVKLAGAAGEKAAQNPKLSIGDCPSRYDEDEKSYWTAAFRRERRR
jgi:hypothetical protein